LLQRSIRRSNDTQRSLMGETGETEPRACPPDPPLLADASASFRLSKPESAWTFDVARGAQRDRFSRGDERQRVGEVHMDKIEFSTLLDRSGLTLTEPQKAELFAAYPLFHAMIVRATPAMPREAEPSVIFVPEVK
jgi:hypothetical protein